MAPGNVNADDLMPPAYVVALETFTGAGGPTIVSLTAPAGTSFDSVEVRTRGNPGIGFLGNVGDRIQFTFIPEPTTAGLLGTAGLLTLLRRRR